MGQQLSLTSLEDPCQAPATSVTALSGGLYLGLPSCDSALKLALSATCMGTLSHTVAGSGHVLTEVCLPREGPLLQQREGETSGWAWWLRSSQPGAPPWAPARRGAEG